LANEATGTSVEKRQSGRLRKEERSHSNGSLAKRNLKKKPFGQNLAKNKKL
jgi:hypothetical protein